MILRFRAEPGQVGNVRLRIYSQDRSTLLGTFTVAIAETIANSGSYQCEIGALTGFWYVLVDLVDTGEVTSDGFANQWVPEVLDTLTVESSGSGAYLITVTVQNSSAEAVQGALVTVQNSAGTANVAWGSTDANGQAIFALDAATYSVLVQGPSTAYASLAAQSLIVSANASVTYTLTAQSIDPPATAGLCTVRFLVQNSSGTAVQGAKVVAELIDDNPMVDTALISRSQLTGTTNASGYVDLVMIQKASFTKGGTYSVQVTTGSRVIHKRNVTVPTLGSCYAEDLVDA